MKLLSDIALSSYDDPREMFGFKFGCISRMVRHKRGNMGTKLSRNYHFETYKF